MEKPGEFRGHPMRTILSQAAGRRKVQRLSRKGVHASAWKRPAPHWGDDIVSPARQRAAVRKDGAGLATLCPKKAIQTQYKLEHLATLLTADTVYGVGELRNDAGIVLMVPGV